MAETLQIPAVSETSWTKYQSLRTAPLDTLKFGMLPTLIKALAEYAALTAALADPDAFAEGDQAKLAVYHPQAIALVAPAIDAMIQQMQSIRMIAHQVDTAFVAEGRSPLFGVQ